MDSGAIEENLISDDTQLYTQIISQEGELVPPSSSILIRLYLGHFLSKWGDRMWDFAVGLFMIHIWPDSLTLTATYGLVETASLTVFGVFVGDWVGKTAALKVMRISLVIQNASMFIAALAVMGLLGYSDSLSGSNKIAVVVLIVMINAFGASGALAGLAGSIQLERDWVVVISGGTPSILAEMNSVMRRIDLCCKLVAPVFVGILMSSISVASSAAIIALWNLLTFGFEYWLLYSVYSSTPSLEYRTNAPQGVTAQEAGYIEEENNQQEEGLSITKAVHKATNFSIFQGLSIYIKQQAALAGLALALLYFTVLSFGSLMTAVLEWKGVPAYVLGLARGVSALVGVGATFAYPKIHAYVPTVRAGLWSIWFQSSCLSVCVVSTFMQNQTLSAELLISGVVISRFGLWMFDLAVTEIMQESVPEAERGVVGGVQSSLESFMDMVSYIVAIIVPNPKDFGSLVIVSFLVVMSAGLIYSRHSYGVRGHLFHFDRIFKTV